MISPLGGEFIKENTMNVDDFNSQYQWVKLAFYVFFKSIAVTRRTLNQSAIV